MLRYADRTHRIIAMPVRRDFSLYVHIPYCISKCPYCDFNSHVVPQIPETEYTDALIRELNYFGAHPDWQGRSVKSVFFGGGTPSVFMPQTIAKILQRIAELFPFELGCEITLEANPGTIDQKNFSGYSQAGINRISVGVQSFQPHLLKFLGRAHSAEEARRALRLVKQAGFENFNLDLIYANPGQSLAELAADLDTALEFQPPHLSAYNLTFEEGTPFHYEQRAGRLRPLNEDEELAMAELIESRLRRAGMERYEISNYAKAGRESRHNVNYWRGGDYLGIGAGAHSYKKLNAQSAVRARRWSNEKNPGRYMARLAEADDAIVDREEISREQAATEFMFLGLRMIQGVSVDLFRADFDQSPAKYFPRIAEWLEAGFMEEQTGYVRLTDRGMMVANSIFVHFM
jgi:putative oxygen-independent coproporphyrinogen III oxidase